MTVTDATRNVLDGDRTFAAVVVETDEAGALPDDLDIRRALQDLAFVGVPVSPCRPGDSGRALDRLAVRGLTGSLVLYVARCGSVGPAPTARVVVVPTEPADALCAVLREQAERRRSGRVPDVDEDPRWMVELPADRGRERVAEAMGALANGTIGARASLEEDGAGAVPMLVAAGVYTDEEVPQLVTGPDWAGLALTRTSPGRRVLDLRTGVLVRDDAGSGFRSARLTSMARPAALVLRAEAPPTAWVDPGPGSGGDEATRTGAGCGGGISVAVRERVEVAARRQRVDRFAAAVADPLRPPSAASASATADLLADLGFDRLLAEHRAAWADRWRDAEVTIEGAPGDELAARFAVFHLLGAAAPGREAAVGPRGLTGPAYGGHVFWDADVFVLPALAALRPGAAAAMLAYRDHRLPAALAAARAGGLAGARFPWESAADGREVTPLYVGRSGRLVEVLTDDHEEHIVADVAWAADRLLRWTGCRSPAATAAPRILRETGRYWASRLAREPDPAHLRGVMGPDEYHELVDDDVFTNGMARWNLRRAARELDDPDEAARWRALADRLVDGWDATLGCHEQFAGYWDLEPLTAAEVSDPPFSADLLLGAERVAGSQLIKQPDVLMLHHMAPDEAGPASLTADLATYGPRTVHGSSLSPAIHSALHARASQPDRALALFRMAARLDLDDLTGTTAGGVHLATMGGLWQALASGFLGLAPTDGGLSVDPCLPDEWTSLRLRFRLRGQRLEVIADHEAVHVACERPLTLVVGRRRVRCEPPGTTVPLRIREEPA